MAYISSNVLVSSKKKRPGVHSKTKTSRSKNAKYYKKAYRGQGKR